MLMPSLSGKSLGRQDLGEWHLCYTLARGQWKEGWKSFLVQFCVFLLDLLYQISLQ